jgi:hypothetical protein
MSVTLRYSGTLADPELLDRLKEDFHDIAATHAWPVDDLVAPPQEAPRRGRGRTLAPALVVQGLKIYVHPQTDPLWLTFDQDGLLTRLGSYPLAQVGRDGENATASRYGFVHQSQASMQTSIGGFLLHSTAVSLLDYLKRAYVPGLKVEDETGYWETRDLDKLKRLMAGL